MSWWLSPIDQIDEGLRLQQAHEAWVLPAAYKRLGAGVTNLGRDGRYELVGLLNQGGQAYLWAARDSGNDDRLVVIKTATPRSDDPVGDQRLTREARLLERLAGEPTIMPLLDWGPGRARGEGTHGEYETKHPWLILPYRPHLSLDRAVRLNGGPLDVDAAWRIGRDIAAGLSHMHRRGIIHRDLSLRNVLLTPTGCLIADLGMAWSETSADEKFEHWLTTGLTRQSRGVTWGWLAPEAAQAPHDGHRPDRTPAADVFCWGLHVFCALAGHHPWDPDRFGVSDERSFEMYEQRRPPDLRDLQRDDLPREIGVAVRAALDSDPRERPTADELLRLLGKRPPSESATQDALAGLRTEVQESKLGLAAARAEAASARVSAQRTISLVPAIATPPRAADPLSRSLLLTGALTLVFGLLGLHLVTDLGTVQSASRLQAETAVMASGHTLLTELATEWGVVSTKGTASQRKVTDMAVADLKAQLGHEPPGGWDPAETAARHAFTGVVGGLSSIRVNIDGTRDDSFVRRSPMYREQVAAVADVISVMATSANQHASGNAASLVQSSTDLAQAQQVLADMTGATLQSVNSSAMPALAFEPGPEFVVSNPDYKYGNLSDLTSTKALYLAAMASARTAADDQTIKKLAVLSDDERAIDAIADGVKNTLSLASATRRQLLGVVRDMQGRVGVTGTDAAQRADAAAATTKKWASLRVLLESIAAVVLLGLLAAWILATRRGRPRPAPAPVHDPTPVEGIDVTRLYRPSTRTALEDPEHTRDAPVVVDLRSERGTDTVMRDRAWTPR